MFWGSKLTLSWMKASCVDPDMTKASERPATDFFGSTVARKKLHDSGQNCADDIFLFWISKAEFAHHGQEKTRCLWRSGGLCLRQERMPGSAAFNTSHGGRRFRSARARHRPGTSYPLGCGHPVLEARAVWDLAL